MRNKLSLLLGSLVLLAGATGCSEVEPGDYIVYRIASAQEELSSGCNMGINVESDSTSIRSSSTIILFAGAEDAYYLDTGDITLDGEFSGETDAGAEYEFAGESTDVEWDDPDGMTNRRVTTVSYDIDLAVDGAMLDGKSKIKTSFSCTGPSCGDLPDTCTKTVRFIGTEVEDVELKYDVD